MQNNPLLSIFMFQLLCLFRLNKQSTRFGLTSVGVMAFGAIALTAQAVSAAALTNWQYDSTKNQLELTVKDGTKPTYFVMAQPARIVVDLPNTEMGEVKATGAFSGAVSQVRVSQFKPGVTRIVLQLSPDVELAPGQVKLEAKGDRLVLRPLISGVSTSVAKAPKPASKPAVKPEPALPTAGTKPSKTALTPPAKVEPVPPAPLVDTPSKPSLVRAEPSVAQPSAIGADVSPVIAEPPIPSVTVPPLSTPKLAPAPVTVPPLSTPKLAPVPKLIQPLAQLPAEATTPLPPASVTPPTGLEIESGNAVPISVPPPVSVPSTQPEILIEAPQASPIGQSQPIQASTIVPTLEIPSTVRSVPTNAPPQVTVPTLSLPPQTANTVKLPVATPTPPPIAVPPLNSVPKPAAPVVNPPVPTVVQVSVPPASGERIFESPMPDSRQVVSPQTPASVKANPPNSWVMQSAGGVSPATASPGIVNVPPAAVSVPPMLPAPAASAPTVTKVTLPPTSWVMQSSNLSVPSLTRPLPPPPVSSVIQAPAAQSSSIQPAGINSTALPGTIPMQPVAIAPTSFPTGTPTVSVPPLQSSPNMGVTPTVAVPPLPTSTGVGVAPTVSVPPLQSSVSAPSMPPAPANSSVVEFGKPLPTNGATSLNTMPRGIPTGPSLGGQPIGVVQSANSAVALSIGTVLTLSYPGATELQLDSGARQDMMVLQTEVRDASGNVVFPQGSYVMGQFETSPAGSKFVTSSIQRGDRIIPFLAESETLAEGSRDISATSMAIYSGAGALAGGLVSQFSAWGLLLGGAAGAATNYFTSPKAATIQPGQVVQVRMLRDVPY